MAQLQVKMDPLKQFARQERLHGPYSFVAGHLQKKLKALSYGARVKQEGKKAGAAEGKKQQLGKDDDTRLLVSWLRPPELSDWDDAKKAAAAKKARRARKKRSAAQRHRSRSRSPQRKRDESRPANAAAEVAGTGDAEGAASAKEKEKAAGDAAATGGAGGEGAPLSK